MSKTISARIDDTLHTMITDEANQEGITVNEKLKGMLNNHFNEEGKKEISQSVNETFDKAIGILDKKQSNLDNNLKEIFKILDRISDRISENEVKILQTIDQQIKNHENHFKHDIKCIDNGLRCNSS